VMVPTVGFDIMDVRVHINSGVMTREILALKL
jgi:hypothetical protein